MALPDDLLEQASHLVNREPKKPKQASLRRAVSTAYYAVFHLLTDESARRFFPNQPAGLRERAKRAYAHNDMSLVCRQFAKGLPDNLNDGTKALITAPLEPNLASVAEAFVELLEARHRADYDMSATFIRPEALLLIDVAQKAFTSWRGVRATPNATVFLAALLLQKNWNK